MEIIYTKQALKQIGKLDKPTQKRIITAIAKLPAGDIKRLQSVVPITFRLRVGDFRVLFEMSPEKITVRSVLPRGEAYNRL